MYFVSVIKLKRTHGLSSKIHFGSEDLTRLARLQLARLSDQRMVTCRDANLLALVIRGWLHHIDASLREKTMRNLMLGANDLAGGHDATMDRLEENEVVMEEEASEGAQTQCPSPIEPLMVAAK